MDFNNKNAPDFTGDFDGSAARPQLGNGF